MRIGNGARKSRALVGLVAIGLVGLTAMSGETVEKRSRFARPSAEEAPSEPKRERTREGAKLTAELGEFDVAGKDRIRFYLNDGKTSFVALENLALERVAKVLDENTSPRTWSVSGVVSEYRGENFLLVTRASLKARGHQGNKVKRLK